MEEDLVLEMEMLQPYVDIEANETEERPYEIDYSLSSYGIDFDVTGLVRRLNNKSIYLPDFQRNYVWNQKKASRFIESMLLGLPVPGIFLYKEEDSQTMLIIDGFQRLETLRNFYKGVFGKRKFVLTDVVSDLEGKCYDDLAENLRRKLDDTLLHATVIKADDPEEKNFDAIYLIFERLNTGGINLSPQEIRNCVSHGDFQKKLIEISAGELPKSVLKIDGKRKKDQEIILRLIALSHSHMNYTGNMKQFLNDFMFKNRKIDEPDVAHIIAEFNSISDFISQNSIDQVFRPNGQLSIAILDSIWVGIWKNFDHLKVMTKEHFRSRIDALLFDPAFEKAIRTGKTHHTESVKNRINLAISALSK